MSEKNELTYEELVYEYKMPVTKCDALVKTRTVKGLIGNENVLESLELGLNIKELGYNIYVVSELFQHDEKLLKEFIEIVTQDKKVPDDWCYVYNFEDENKPIALNFKAKEGKIFKDNINEVVDEIQTELIKQFDSIEYELQKKNIEDKYEKKTAKLIEEIESDATQNQFETEITDKDIYFIPIINEEKLSEDMFENLTKEQQDKVLQKSEILQERATTILKEIKIYQKTEDEEIKQLKFNISEVVINSLMKGVIDHYKENEKIYKYVLLLKEYMLQHPSAFKKEEDLLSIVPQVYVGSKEDEKDKFAVNLFLDNSHLKSAPVIIGYDLTSKGLIGQIECAADIGSSKKDILKIKSGFLHEANGGFLILNIEELLYNQGAWHLLKQVLKTNKINCNLCKDRSGLLMGSNLSPEEIEVSVKIVLVGDEYYYSLLKNYDTSFSSLFKMKYIIESEVKVSKNVITEFLYKIESFKMDKNIKPLEDDAKLYLLRSYSRKVMNRNKIATNLETAYQTLIEANEIVEANNQNIITKEILTEAIKVKENRVNYYERRLDEFIEQEHILIDVESKKIGQINALAVLDTGDYMFAKPSKITVTTYASNKGIVNIEKETRLSGKIHDKGVEILTGYLNQRYAYRNPFSLSCRICFEQTYSQVDGDSATCAELVAILSSLAKIKINQGIGVTGSMNQFGEVQSVGGVTYKIEGFYKVCKKRGLTGKQGVIIPYQNKNDLMLNDQILQDIKKGLFHIYTAKTIDDVLERLTDMSANKIHKKVIKIHKNQ